MQSAGILGSQLEPKNRRHAYQHLIDSLHELKARNLSSLLMLTILPGPLGLKVRRGDTKRGQDMGLTVPHLYQKESGDSRGGHLDILRSWEGKAKNRPCCVRGAWGE